MSGSREAARIELQYPNPRARRIWPRMNGSGSRPTTCPAMITSFGSTLTHGPEPLAWPDPWELMAMPGGQP